MFSCLCVHACTYGGLGPPCISMLGLFLCGNLSLAWNLPSRLGWPARPLGFSCLRFPSTGITSECQHACLLMPLLLIKFMACPAGVLQTLPQNHFSIFFLYWSILPAITVDLPGNGADLTGKKLSIIKLTNCVLLLGCWTQWSMGLENWDQLKKQATER